MKRKWLIGIIAAIFVSLLSYFILAKNNDNQKKDSLCAISDTSNYSDVIMFLDNVKKGDGMLFEIPQEGTVQDYNTYYGNEILRLLDEDETDNIIKYVDAAVSDADFMIYKNGDIFESIEKVYYLQKLADNCNMEYRNEKIQEIVLGLINSSYDKEGFFYYSEFDDYLTDMSEQEIRTMRICHMMMTLYLCKEYDLINKLDIESIKKYIMDAVTDNKDVINLYYAYLCYDYLSEDTTYFYKQKIGYDSNELDILELNAYVSLADKLGIPLEKDIISARMNGYVAECRVSNMMELFIAIDTLSKLEESMDNDIKEKIISLFHMYQNTDGTFPIISSYLLDNKQVLMYYTMTARMGMQFDLREYANLLSNNFEEQDYYDLYAYAYFTSRLGMETDKLERVLIGNLKQSTLENQSSIGYALLALSELDTKIENSYINSQVMDYIKLITSSEAIEYNVQDLILLYGCLKSGVIEATDSMVASVKNIDIEKAESMQALTVYYKYEILTYIEKEMGKVIISDRTELNNIIAGLRCKGGFKMDKDNQFMDLQASYYLLNLLSICY